MKISHFFALLKIDSLVVYAFLPLALIYAYIDTKDYRPDRMFDLTPDVATGSFLFILPFMLWNVLFRSDHYGLKASPAAAIGILEFMFTRAIDRASLFFAKATLYLLLCSMPLALMWAYSYTAPVIRIELPYNTPQHRQETKQFYLSHFENSYLQEPDSGKNKDYVVLPQGRTGQAMCTFLFAFAYMLLFQVALFAFSRRRWIALLALLVIVSFFPFADLLYSRGTPSLYEAGLAWITQHTPLAFLGLGLLTLLAQLYCCRRFINTEITS